MLISVDIRLEKEERGWGGVRYEIRKVRKVEERNCKQHVNEK